jgi:CheY-like chemotaxis protein
VPSTVLAVDDSVTMRKVLEITFAGPDFNVITVDSADAALQKLKQVKADVVVADVTLEPKSGYDLCKAIKQSTPNVPILILSSKQNPFDAARGSAAQADDHIDKPFDTQQMIDKVKKLLSGGKAEPAAAQAPQRASNPLASTIVGQSPPAPNRGQPAAPTPAAPGVQPAAAARAAAAAAAAQPQRAQTLVYNPGPIPPVAATAPMAQTRPLATSGRPAGAGAPAAAAMPRTNTLTSPLGVAATAEGGQLAQINGQMAAKLEELGLTPQQVDAVVALSREVVERVVWEVVPVLAETIIKEEIARLTK